MTILNLLIMTTPSRTARSKVAFASQVVNARRFYLDSGRDHRASLSIVCGGYEEMRQDYEIERSTFPYRCVEFVAAGSGRLWLNGQPFSLQPGVVFSYGPGISHRIRTDAENPMRKYYIDFAGRQAHSLLAATPIFEVPMQITAPQEIINLFEALHDDANVDGPLLSPLLNAHLRLLLLKIAQKALPLGKAQPRALISYHRARGAMEAHFEHLHTVEEIAMTCCITPIYLSRIFRRFGKTTPYQYLLRLKMNRAAELLFESSFLVKEVASKLGFSCAFQFSRTFKRFYGVSPDHFLRNHPRRPKNLNF